MSLIKKVDRAESVLLAPQALFKRQNRTMNTLSFNITEKGVTVGGKTFAVKEILKKAGAIWDGGMWLFRGQKSIDVVSDLIRDEVDTTVAAAAAVIKEERKAVRAAKKKHREWVATPEGQVWALAENKKRMLERLAIKATGEGPWSWICCENCVIIDEGRQHSWCTSCGRDGNCFFRRGMLFTGD
jgi:hypothetical protein